MTDFEKQQQEAMEKEYGKTSGGNYFNYVDTSKLEREGITQWKPSLGVNQIRIVFPPDRVGYFGMEIYKHSNIGTSRKTFICRQRMFDEMDPICEFVAQLRKLDPQDERIGPIRESRRYLFFVVDIASKDAEREGVRWFDCPVGLFNEIKSRSRAKRKRGDDTEDNFAKYVNVSDPKNGKDISFEQVKEKGKYSYVGCTLEDGPSIPASWYENLPEFKDILKVSSVDEMLEAVGDQFDVEPAKTTEREEPSQTRSETRGDTEERGGFESEDAEVDDTETRKPAETSERQEVREERQERVAETSKETSGADDIKSRVQARLAKAREARGS